VLLGGALGQTSGKGATAFVKRGAGALSVIGVSGTYNWSAAGSRATVAVDEGTLRFGVGTTNTIDTDVGAVTTLSVGNVPGRQGTLRVETNAVLTLRNDLRVGTAVGATGVVEIAAATVNAGWLNVGPTNNMNGVLRITDRGWLSVSKNSGEIGVGGYYSGDTGAYAFLDIRSGGLLTVTNGSGQNFQMGRYGAARVDVDAGSLFCRGWTCPGRFPTGLGELNIRNGGLVEHGYENTGAGAFGVAEQGRGVVNVLTGGVLRARYNFFLSLNNIASQRTTVNLWNGGAVEPNRFVPSAVGSTVTNTLNFHGGVLRAYATNNTDFLRLHLAATDASRALVWPEGAVVDSSGKDVTVLEPLQAPTGQGVVSVPIVSGGRYLTPPVLWLSGGNGVGATASAVLDANGAITNVFITNPGIGYTAAPTVVVNGGFASAAASFGTVVLGSNASGGLTKQGLGVVTLTGTNSTYTGVTEVAAGTLKAAANILTGTAGYRVATNAVFDLSGTAHTVGLLAGAGVVTNGSIAVTNRLELGDATNAVGTLTVAGDVVLAPKSGVVFDFAGTSQDTLAVVGSLTLGNGGWVDVGRSTANPLTTPFERLAMTFTGVCTNNACGWRVVNSGRSASMLVASFETRGQQVYLIVRYAGTLMLLR
jgi:autotransporter-associated beta strand protein